MPQFVQFEESSSSSAVCIPKEWSHQNQTFICLISDNCAFSINGIEIDLKELEIYEKRLAEKRRQLHPITAASQSSVTHANTEEFDDLDDYLDKLNTAAASASASSAQGTTDTVSNNEQQPHDVGVNCSDTEIVNHQMPLPLLLYGVMSIMFVLSTVARQNNLWVWIKTGDVHL